MNRTIYIDFDDVLCETARILAKIIKDEFGKDTAYEEIDSFDLTKSFGLDEDESSRLFDIFHDPAVLAAMQPIEGAAETLAFWKSSGVQIHIVTGRPPATCEASRAWLDAHSMQYDRLSFVDKYNRNHAAVPNVEILSLDELKQLRFLAAIDDSPVAIAFLIENTENPVIVFDRPWNADVDEKKIGRATRCHNWNDVREYVDKLMLN